MDYSVFGWIGSICFAISGAPQALLSYKQGHSRGIANGLLVLWLVGELGSLVYALSLANWVFVLNYAGNLAFLSVILYYKLRPRVVDWTPYEPTGVYTAPKSGTYRVEGTFNRAGSTMEVSVGDVIITDWEHYFCKRYPEMSARYRRVGYNMEVSLLDSEIFPGNMYDTSRFKIQGMIFSNNLLPAGFTRYSEQGAEDPTPIKAVPMLFQDSLGNVHFSQKFEFSVRIQGWGG